MVIVKKGEKKIKIWKQRVKATEQVALSRYCCHEDKTHVQCSILSAHKRYISAISSSPPALFCLNKINNKKIHHMDTWQKALKTF